MAEAVARVALLARAGNARDQLHRALTELGAVLVAEGDPSELDPDQVVSQSPTLVVVSLEPAVESALDRFESLLALPDVQVMYDDAEVTRQLDGWDLNRWARHLAAKLLGHDTLPPVPGGSDGVPGLELTPVPGAPPTPAQLMDDAKLEEYTHDAPELAEWVPTEPSLTAAETGASDAADAAALDDFEFDAGDVEASLQAIDAPSQGHEDAGLSLPTSDDDLTLDNDFSLEVDLSHLEADAGAPAAESTLPLEDDSSTLADFEPAAGTVRFSKFGDEADAAPEELGDLDADVAALAAQLDAFEQSDTREAPRDPDFAISLDEPVGKDEAPAPATSAERSPATKTSAPASFDFGNLELASEDTLPPPGPPPPPKPGTSKLLDSVSLTLAPLEDEDPPATPAQAPPKPAPREEAPKVNFGGLSLESMDAPSAPTTVLAAIKAAPGAVLVLAGMGGPDAVRQLLLNLPETLPVPVLLYQHLEVGKHERLAEQLAKISRLPVSLAADGGIAEPGCVSVLPAGMSALADGASLRFSPGPLTMLLSALPAAESVIIVLSGADPALVPAAMSLRGGGAMVLAQETENCFDPAAAQAVAAQGGEVHPAAALADQVAKRWPA